MAAVIKSSARGYKPSQLLKLPKSALSICQTFLCLAICLIALRQPAAQGTVAPIVVQIPRTVAASRRRRRTRIAFFIFQRRAGLARISGKLAARGYAAVSGIIFITFAGVYFSLVFLRLTAETRLSVGNIAVRIGFNLGIGISEASGTFAFCIYGILRTFLRIIGFFPLRAADNIPLPAADFRI